MASQKSDKQRAIKGIESVCERAVARAIARIEGTGEHDVLTRPARTFAANEIRRLAKAAIAAVQQDDGDIFPEPEEMSGMYHLSDIVNETVAEACRAFNTHLDNYFG